MNWLQSGIDRFVEVEKSQDLAELFSAYDDLTWKILTSNNVELEIAVKNIWEEPLSKIPIPLQVLMCRLLLSKVHQFSPQAESAFNFIRCHCSPEEEKNALQGIVLPDED